MHYVALTGAFIKIVTGTACLSSTTTKTLLIKHYKYQQKKLCRKYKEAKLTVPRICFV
jgi:hypothetical protein